MSVISVVTQKYNRPELLKREKFNSAKGGKLYRKTLMENVIAPSVQHFRDIHREYRMLNNVRRIVVASKPMFYFYRHDANASGLNTPQHITPAKIRRHLEANTIRTGWQTEHMPEIAEFIHYCELSFMISLYERIHRLAVVSCYEIAEDMKQRLIVSAPFLAGCGHLTESERSNLDERILCR